MPSHLPWWACEARHASRAVTVLPWGVLPVTPRAISSRRDGSRSVESGGGGPWAKQWRWGDWRTAWGLWGGWSMGPMPRLRGGLGRMEHGA